MTTDAPAAGASLDLEDTDEPPCAACMEPANRGLCHSEYCRRAVLPQIKQNGGLLRLMAEASFDGYATLVETPALDPAVARAERREQRKVERRAERLVSVAFGGPRGRNARRSA